MIVDDKNEKINNKPRPHEFTPLPDESKKALLECKRKKVFAEAVDFPEITEKTFRQVCEYVASGYSPVDACRYTGTSIDSFFLFKHKNKDNPDLMSVYDDAFKSKGGVFIGRCEEVINGLLEGKINARTAEIAINGLFKLAAIADKKYSDSPRIEVDARSVNINQLDTDKMLELHNLLTGK